MFFLKWMAEAVKSNRKYCSWKIKYVCTAKVNTLFSLLTADSVRSQFTKVSGKVGYDV